MFGTRSGADDHTPRWQRACLKSPESTIRASYREPGSTVEATLSAGMPSKRRRPRAIIIGGSMSGLFTAAFLRQIGWQADVYERSGVELVGRGAGITTHPELLAALEASGAGTRELGVTVDRRIALDLRGEVIAEKHLTQILTSWDRLQRLLRATIDPAHYHLGCNFERVEQNGSGVRVHFNGGRVEHADILIGGDGVRS